MGLNCLFFLPILLLLLILPRVSVLSLCFSVALALNIKVWSSKSEDGETSDFSLKPANRKLKDYMNVKFQTIRVCSGALNSKTGGANCHAYTFESTCKCIVYFLEVAGYFPIYGS